MRAIPAILSLALGLAAPAACRRSQPASGPTVEVRVDVPGATAADVEVSTTLPIERACARVGHVAHIGSTSESGRSTVSVRLASGADVDAAFEGIRSQLQLVLGQLPVTATPPLVTRARGALVGRYVVTSDTLPLGQLGEALRGTLLRRIEMTAGVGAVVTCGEVSRRVTVDVDAAALAATGLTIADVVAALAPLSPLRTGGAEALPPLIIAMVKGAPIRLRDVARVADDAAPSACRAYGDRGALFEAAVYAQPSADVRAIRAALAQSISGALPELPPGLDVRALGAGHVLDVELDPDVSLAGAITALREPVRTASAGTPFVLEIDTSDGREPSPLGARVVLDTGEDAAVQKVAVALAMVSVVHGAGEPNATVEIVGPDRAALFAAAPELQKRLAERGVLVDRWGTVARPVEVHRVDRAAAARLGVSIADATLAIQALRDGKVVSGVLVRIDGSLDHVYVRAGASAIPLSALVSVAAEPAPAALLRDDQFPAVGARVHASDLASLQHVFEPPPGIMLRVVADP